MQTLKPGLHSQNSLLCVSLNMKGVIHYKVLECERTITADIYYRHLDQVNETLCQRCPALIKRKHVILQHDNDSAKQNQGRKMIVRMGGSSTPAILTRFCTCRFSFVSITRTFHERQSIQKQRRRNWQLSVKFIF